MEPAAAPRFEEALLSGRCAILLVLLLAVVGPRTVSAQTPDKDREAVAALEKLRALWHEAEAAAAAGDHRRAAALYSEMAALPQLFPVPFTLDDPREVLAEKVQAARRAWSGKLREDATGDQRKALGTQCDTCQGTGFVSCGRCNGTGMVDVAQGRRVRKEECVPWAPCAPCHGTGRRGCTPDAERMLSGLWELAAAEAAKKDPLVAIKDVLKALKGRETWGWRIPAAPTDLLRRTVGTDPPDPERFKEDVRTRLKEAWGVVTPVARRAFLQALALDVLAWARALSWLDAAAEVPAGAQVVRDAVPLDLEDLTAGLAPTDKAYVVRVVGEEPTPAWLAQAALPLAGRIPIQGVDPRFALFCCYTPEDLEAIAVLGRLGLLARAEKLLRSYPPRAVPKALKDLGPGTPLKLTGRLLKGRGGGPLFVFEVWQVDADSGGGGGR